MDACVLASVQRLRRSSDFGRVMRSGHRAAAGRVVAHVTTELIEGSSTAASGDEVRIGLIVSKAVGGAVERNLVKRRLRAAARGYLASECDGRSTVSITSGDGGLARTDIVLRALPGAAERRYGELAGDVTRAIGRARRAPAGKRP